MRKILALLIVVAFLAGCTQMGAEEMAKKIEEKYNSIQDFKGTLRYTAISKNGNFTMEYEYVFKKPNKLWMYSKKMETLMVSNGERMWTYDKRKNEVFVMNISNYGAVNPDYGRIVKDMLKRYDVELVGAEKVSGRNCFVIELKSKDGNERVKMWVDVKFWYPLKIESESNGIKWIMEYSNMEFNTGVSDELFKFKIPEGAKVKTEKDVGIQKFKSLGEAREHVNFTIFEPEYTAGYRLKEVKVIGKVVSLSYIKGSKILTIFETPNGKLPKLSNSEKVRVGDIEGVYAELYGNGMLSFKIDRTMISITGQLEKGELLKIAESMKS